MAQNYVGSGRVITIVADRDITSGEAVYSGGFTGVALIDALNGEPLTMQLDGVFTLTLAGVSAGALIYITTADDTLSTAAGVGKVVFGRALSASDGANRFQCRLLQAQS